MAEFFFAKGKGAHRFRALDSERGLKIRSDRFAESEFRNRCTTRTLEAWRKPPVGNRCGGDQLARGNEGFLEFLFSSPCALRLVTECYVPGRTIGSP